MLSLNAIKNLIAAEMPQASAEVHNFVTWIESKENEILAAETEFNNLIARQQALGAALTRAGYTVNAGTLTKPAQ